LALIHGDDTENPNWLSPGYFLVGQGIYQSASLESPAATNKRPNKAFGSARWCWLGRDISTHIADCISVISRIIFHRYKASVLKAL
jgi:hypothetical protein